MPEGDTLVRAARRLSEVLEGEVCVSGFARSQQGEVNLAGLRITSVWTHGKNLFIDFSDGRTLRTHLRMNGTWTAFEGKPRWPIGGPETVVALTTVLGTAMCNNAPTVQLDRSDRIASDVSVRDLGPDILAPVWNENESVARLRSRSTALGIAIVDQTAIAGIGNIYKSEGLFQVRLNPFVAASELSSEKATELLKTIRKMMQRALQPGPRRTRARGSGPAFWVYRRKDEHCLVCDARIGMRRQGPLLRSTYYCPECQDPQGLANAPDVDTPAAREPEES